MNVTTTNNLGFDGPDISFAPDERAIVRLGPWCSAVVGAGTETTCIHMSNDFSTPEARYHSTDEHSDGFVVLHTSDIRLFLSEEQALRIASAVKHIYWEVADEPVEA